MRWIKAAIQFFLVLLIASCANTTKFSQQILTTPESADLNSELVQKSIKLRRSFSAADYKIGHDDLLEIDVFQVEELKKSVRVSARGYIKLPLIGKIKVAGLTVSELESLISERLDEYIEEPVASVFVKEYRSQQITVLGAVRKPQVYSVSGQKYLLDMLSMAGGLTEEAKNICYIQKMTENGLSDRQYAGTIVIDLEELLMNGRADLNIPISSGDVIHVPKSDVFFVDGAVGSPGSFKIKGETTLIQAISMAKGLNFEADRSDIRIYRDNGKPERDVITADYNSILDRKSPDIEIKDKDVIIATKSGFKSFVKGIGATLNLGIFSLGKGF